VACWLVWWCSLVVEFVALRLAAVMPSARLLCQSPKKQRLFVVLDQIIVMVFALATAPCVFSERLCCEPKRLIGVVSGLTRSAGNPPQPASQDRPESITIAASARNRKLSIL
jgi:hypothetical protein